MPKDNDDHSHAAAMHGGHIGGEDPKIFVVERELAEVHLLLENLSTNPDRTLSIEPKPEDRLPDDWIEKICEIEWPPHGAKRKMAEQAELLIRAKDFLNRQAKPASGYSIAFTVLVIEADKPSQGASRHALAVQAYPDLAEPARNFFRFKDGIHLFVAACLVITCLTSWYTAFGSAALSQRVAAQAAVDAAQSKRDAAELTANPPLAATAPAAQLPVSGGSDKTYTPLPSPQYATRLCERSRHLQTLSGTKTEAVQQFYSVQDIQTCDRWYTARYNLEQIDKVLESWLPPSLPWTSFDPRNQYFGDNVTTQVRAATLLNVLGGGVLPVLYGLLGAGAAVVRSLSRKFKESRLTPRDLTLSLQQLALGAVMGSCISLFVVQPGAGSQPTAGLISAVALSSSALSFVAGFGVEQVFSTLESIIRRVFPGDSTPAGPPVKAN